MELLKLLYVILIHLPEILRLVKRAKDRQLDKAEADKIKEDRKEIDEAFKSRDSDRLRAVFRDGVR